MRSLSRKGGETRHAHFRCPAETIAAMRDLAERRGTTYSQEWRSAAERHLADAE